jgi:hypothetical protein
MPPLLVPPRRVPGACGANMCADNTNPNKHMALRALPTSVAVVRPIAQTLTFLSSPPVANTPDVFRPIRTHRTSPLCAANSTALTARHQESAMGVIRQLRRSCCLRCCHIKLTELLVPWPPSHAAVAAVYTWQDAGHRAPLLLQLRGGLGMPLGRQVAHYLPKYVKELGEEVRMVV